MRRLGMGGLAAALLGLTVSVAGARGPLDDKEEPPGKAESKSSWSNWFGRGDKPKEDVGKVVDRPVTPSPADRAAREQKRAMNAFLRRMQVCDRLREVAFNAGDAELERQANNLEEQARALYEQQTARLPRGGTQDEMALDQSLATGTALPRSRAGQGAEDGRAAYTGERKP